MTLKQSGRLAVTSKSMTASPSPQGSMAASSNPRRPRRWPISSAGAVISTKSRSHETSRRIDSRKLATHEITNGSAPTLIGKLFQKPQIVLVKQSDVLHPVPQNRNALDADAPGKTRIPLGIVPDGLEDRRMHHAAAAQLDPARFLAHRAAGAVALPAAQIDLRARLRVRKKARTEPYANGWREHLAREREQRPLEIGQRQSFTHSEPFDLTERRRVRQIEIVAPVHAARHHDADWRLVRLHVADLHRRRVRAQQRPHACIAVESRQRLPEVQRVLHVARGMLRGHVQRVEAVPLVLGLGAFDDGKSHAREDLLELVADDGERMTVPEARRASGQRDVDGSGGEP